MKLFVRLACWLVAVVDSFFPTTPADAASIRADCQPTVGLAGFRTYTLSIELDEGEELRGVDAELIGPFNQVNPFGLPTIFTDANAAIDAVADVSQDTQFLFNSTDVSAIGLEEGPEVLSGALQGIGISNGVVPLVQFVTPVHSSFTVDLSFDLGGSAPFVFFGSASPVPDPMFCVPEPPSGGGLALLVLVASRIGDFQRR